MPAALVPPVAVTRTEILSPSVGPGGATALITVAESTVNEVAEVEPNVTAVPFVKPEPMMDTVFLPAVEPVVGFTMLTAGVARAATPLEVYGRVSLIPDPLVTLSMVPPVASAIKTAAALVLNMNGKLEGK